MTYPSRLKTINRLGLIYGGLGMGSGGTPIIRPWILATGVWNDSGVWDDSAVWNDGV